MEAKDTVRRAVRAGRAARTEQRRAAGASALAALVLAHPAVAAAGTVAAHVSTPSEPGTAVLRAGLAARGTAVLLPVVVGAAPLAWVVDDAGTDPSGRTGLLAGADVVLLPALAVTTDGHRLGQGGGHYDRTLAALVAGSGPRPLLVALAHDDEVLPPGAWPVEGHDVRIDAVATPAGWYDVGGARP